MFEASQGLHFLQVTHVCTATCERYFRMPASSCLKTNNQSINQSIIENSWLVLKWQGSLLCASAMMYCQTDVDFNVCRSVSTCAATMGAASSGRTTALWCSSASGSSLGLTTWTTCCLSPVTGTPCPSTQPCPLTLLRLFLVSTTCTGNCVYDCKGLLCIHPSIYSFMHAFIHSFTSSFLRSFVHLFIAIHMLSPRAIKPAIPFVGVV